MTPSDKLRIDQELERAATARTPRGISAYSVVFGVVVALLLGISIIGIAFGAYKIFIVSNQSDATTVRVATVGSAVDAVSDRQKFVMVTYATAICYDRKNEFEWFSDLNRIERKYNSHPAPDTRDFDRRAAFDRRAVREGAAFDLDKCVAHYITAINNIATSPPASHD